MTSKHDQPTSEAQEQPANARPVAAPAAGPDRGARPLGGDLILVDDTPADLRLLCAMLKDRGYKVRPMTDAPAALEVARAAPPDLVLTDIYMPGMHGYEFCERLKGDAVLKSVPVIFLSALSETRDKVMAFRSGGAAYIQKPCHVDELHAVIQSHLEICRLQRKVAELGERIVNLAQANIDLCSADNLRNDYLARISQELCRPATGLFSLAEDLLGSSRQNPDLAACQAAFAQSRKQVMALVEHALQGRAPE